MQNDFFSLLMPFIGVILVILLAYLGTKYISAKYSKMCSGRHIKVLERVALGQDKSLVLLTVNKKAYVLGVTGKGINTVCEFNEDEIPAETNLNRMDFSYILAESLKKCSFLHMPAKKNENGDGK